MPGRHIVPWGILMTRRIHIMVKRVWLGLVAPARESKGEYAATTKGRVRFDMRELLL